MDQGEQFALRRRNPTIDRICKGILSFAPIKCRQRPADREALAHPGQAGFPRRVGVRHAIMWSDDIPFLALLLYGLEQRDVAPLRVIGHAHWAALPCSSEWCTGRRALWIG